MPKRNNSDIHKLFFFLPKSRRKQVAGIILLTFIAAIAEMASIGAIVPFIAIISDPEATMRNEYVLVLASYFNVSTQREMIFIIASIFSVAAQYRPAIAGSC